jgi:hypothetical protein
VDPGPARADISSVQLQDRKGGSHEAPTDHWWPVVAGARDLVVGGDVTAASTVKSAHGWHVADAVLEDNVGSPPWATAAADNGDTVLVDGTGLLGVAAKTASGGGRFVHLADDGSTQAEGNFASHKLVSFHFYGCDDTILPGVTLCGGEAKLAATLTPEGTSLLIPATLSVDCLIGDEIPTSAVEGIRLNVKDSINFKKTVHSGLTVFIPQE